MAGDLDGYILKRASPSCGMERVKVYTDGGHAGDKAGAGVFARILLEKWPNLPVEEEGRLNDADPPRPLHRARLLPPPLANAGPARPLEPAHLVAFPHRPQAPASAPTTRPATAVWARSSPRPAPFRDEDLFHSYEDEFHRRADVHRATRKRHANVLYHALGYLKERLDRLREAGNRGADRGLPQRSRSPDRPDTLLRHHVVKHGIRYLTGQLYLEPHPRELMLRNRV